MEILAALDGGPEPDKRAPNAPPELLDYDYVNSVEDVEELAWILGTLRRGVHGRYPDLEQHVEQRMLALAPPAVQAQAARLQAPSATPDEIAAAEQELAAWEAEAQARDRGLRSSKGGGASSSRTLPPVRNSPARPSTSLSTEEEAKVPPSQEQQQEHKAEAATPPAPAPAPSSTTAPAPASPASTASTASSSSSSAPSDTDSEASPESPKAPKGEPTPLRVEVRSVDDAMVEAVLELTRKSEALGVSGLSVTGLREAAREAKEEGNARFKGGDFEGAIERYTASLAYDSSSVEHAAVAYANRALAWLKMGRLVETEADCTLALERDGGYAKALLRRAQARFRQGKWAPAREDAEALLRLEEGRGSVGPKEVKEARAMLAALALAKEEPTAAAAVASASAPASAPAQPSVEPEPEALGAAVVKKEHKEGSTVLVGPRPGYRRVVITEEDEEEEGGDESKSSSTPAAPPKEQQSAAAAQSSSSAAPQKTGAEALKEAGNTALKGGDLQGAIDAYTQALALGPPPATRAALLNNRSFAFLRSGAFEKARADAGAVLELEPGNVKALYRRGKAAGAQAGALLASDSVQAVALVEGAVGDLDAALAADPQNVDVRRELKAAKELLARAAGALARRGGKDGSPVGGGKEEAKPKQPAAPSPSPSPSPLKPRTATAAATTAARAPSSSSLLQEVTTRPRLPTAKPGPDKPPQPPQPPQQPQQPKQEPKQEQKENAAPSSATSTTTTKPTADAASSSASAPPIVSPPAFVPIREPSAPPKTLHELEREWRTLRKSPPALARYLKKFPLTAFPRVFKSATDPDVVSGVFRVVAEEMCGGGGREEGEGERADAEAVTRVLEGMTRAEGFGMLRMMLSKADQAHVRRALDFLEGVGAKEDVAALREKYKM